MKQAPSLQRPSRQTGVKSKRNAPQLLWDPSTGRFFPRQMPSLFWVLVL